MLVAVAARVTDALNGLVVGAVVRAHQPDAEQLRHLPDAIAALPTLEFPPLPDTIVPLDADKSAADAMRPRAATTAQQWRASDGWLATRYPAHGARRGSLVLHHGWLAGPVQLAWMRRNLEALRRRGIDLWVPWLPAHGTRARARVPSGVECLSADLVRTRAALTLAVAESLRLVRFVRAHDSIAGTHGSRIGVQGVSLGGWVAALVASVDAQLAAAVLWTPVVDPGETLGESPLAAPIREALAGARVDLEAVRSSMRDVAPIDRRPAFDACRVLVLAGARDNVVRADTLARFIEGWGCNAHWTEHGHISIQWSRSARRAARDFLLERVVEDCVE